MIAFAWSNCGRKPQTPKRPLNCVVEDLTKSSISCQNTFLKETKFFQNFSKSVKKRFKERSLNIFLKDLLKFSKVLDNGVADIFWKNHYSHSREGDSELLEELLKNGVLNWEK